ncbi:hypothetical protein GCM10028808_13270 [Spirosoma migulaei]
MPSVNVSDFFCCPAKPELKDATISTVFNQMKKMPPASFVLFTGTFTPKQASNGDVLPFISPPG